MPSRSEWAEIGRFQLERLQRWRHLRRQPAEADRRVRESAAAVRLEATDAAGQLTELAVDYLWQGHQRALTSGRTVAYYPGAPSIYGARNDAVEGVTRVLPLWAAASNADAAISNRSRQMREQVRGAISNGCNPQHPGYWGTIDDHSTLICEAADVALALWLSRRWFWDTLEEADRRRIACWLGQCVGKSTADNNWHLFVALVDATLSTLEPAHRFTSHDRLARVMEFARADGCFVDGPRGAVDLYNAWGFHYTLYWLAQICPSLDPPARASMLDEFCRWYRYLFTRQGAPLWGRSLCYRLALPTPLLAAALSECPSVNAGTALLAYGATLKFFVSRGALQRGRPTQGVFGEDLRWLDAYSGPASSLWSTRSMVLYLHGKRALELAQARCEATRLPAEVDKVDLWIPAMGARLHTDPATGKATLDFAAESAALQLSAPMQQTLKDRLRQLSFARASRTKQLSGHGTQRIESDLARFRDTRDA